MHGVLEADLTPGRQHLEETHTVTCLLAESIRTTNDSGPVVDLDEQRGKLLVATLAINDVVEREGLTVSIWGSADQADWGTTPLVSFRQRHYCGVYSMLLNLARRPDVRYLRAQWSMRRWGCGSPDPLFGFNVFVEESGARLHSVAAF